MTLQEPLPTNYLSSPLSRPRLAIIPQCPHTDTPKHNTHCLLLMDAAHTPSLPLPPAPAGGFQVPMPLVASCLLLAPFPPYSSPFVLYTSLHHTLRIHNLPFLTLLNDGFVSHEFWSVNDMYQNHMKFVFF